MMQGITLEKLSIGYKSIPKTACTSIKNLFFEIENHGDSYDDHKKKYGDLHIHDYYAKREKSIDDMRDRILIIRDPVERFLSAYSNRVKYHWELCEKYLITKHPDLVNNDFIFNPGLGQFIEFFDHYVKVPSIEWHTRPLCQHLDSNIEIFNRIYQISELDEFVTFLSERSQMKVKLQRLQEGGKKYQVKDLNSSQLDFLIDYYSEDYALLSGRISIDDLYKKWKSPNGKS